MCIRVRSKMSVATAEGLNTRIRLRPNCGETANQIVLGTQRLFERSYTGKMIQVLRPIPVESLKLLVFDLDGTLIDSAQDLCNSVNATLLHRSEERRVGKECRSRW